MTLYGRTGLVSEVVQAEEPVLLVTGDSGVGKSALLAAALLEGQAQGQATTFAPRHLERRPGALQQALLDQLAEVTAPLLTEASLVHRAGNVIVGAAQQIARDRGRELALVIGKELLTLVRARLGADAGQALGEYTMRLVAQQEQGLVARLQAGPDPDALATWLSLAEEVAQLAGGATVVLGIDDADRLPDPDLRQLADLANALPSHVRLCVGHVTGPTTDRGRIRLLREAGARELAVTGLDLPAIQEWMNTEDLDTRIATRVHRMTSGYPLFIDAALAALAATGSLREIEVNEMFASNTRDVLRDLDVETARTARLLSAYADPPPTDRLLAIIGADEATWREMRDRLVHCRLFAATVEGQPWFHELRRQAVWASLDSEERSGAADRAMAELEDRFDQTGNPESLVAMAVIATDSQRTRADPMASYSLEASTKEVAIAGAVLEVAENAGQGPHPDVRTAMGDSLLVHARDAFHGGGDLLGALRRLADHGLLFVVNNQYASVVIPRFSKLAAMLLAGRCSAELGRLPIPRLASSLFRTVLASRIGQFDDARFGLGSPTMTNLAGNLPDRQLGPVRHPPAVLARGLVAGQPFFLSATFSDVARRRQAATQLDGLAEPFIDDRAIITDVLEYPLSRVPTRRFLRAIARLVDVPLNRIMPRLRAESPVELAEAVHRRADTLRLIRALCERGERYALELEEPIRLVFASHGDAQLIAEVLGGEDGFVELGEFSAPTIFGTDPYQRYILREQLGLAWNQRLGRVEGRVGLPSSDDPVVETLVLLSKRAESFNRHQPRLDVPLVSEPLQTLLAGAQQRCFDDATALCAALTLATETHPPRPTTTLVVVCPDLPEAEWVEGAHATAGVAVLESSDDHDSLRVYVSAGTDRPDYEQMRQAFVLGFDFELPDGGVSGPVPERRLRYSTYGRAGSVLAELLGHRQDDIRIRL